MNEQKSKTIRTLIPWFLATGVAWSLGFFYNVYYGGELSWLRRMYFQKIAIAESVTETPRLLIVGGSGAHYTIDSDLIEQELGIPVINLGLDGPIGLDVILPSVIDRVKPGDIVLLIPEYLLLLDNDGLGDRSTSFGVAIGRPGLGGIPVKQFLQEVIALGIPSLRAVAKSGVDAATQGEFTGYYSDPVSDKGDPTVVKERQQDWWKLPIKNSISQHSFERILQFNEEVEAKGGKLVLSLPWVYGSDTKRTLKNVEITADYLSKIAPTIYDRESLNIQDNVSYFADTHYHLMPEGRKVRAEQLVTELKPIIKSGNDN
ncbi:conserved hypothetical protein [Hyella patelloides LEGE 07179]|uniref:SGNH hydrolase-type esterase domain-containing protein n=1 Tax=Hyella patelloides LEGE 07179 TaxID=945734 RepID=A0A563VJX7_9CYAN|nr:hypothetical protein [Hyella patelloides]VEP11728.1 conserved hypothetical protein [Hyella patelloides LEGE 07179]